MAIEPTRVREERMRYEVLAAIYHAAERMPCVQIDSRHFLAGLGIWRGELERMVEYLSGCGFLTLGEEAAASAQPEGVVACITQRGIDYIQRDARRRRTVRDELPLHGG